MVICENQYLWCGLVLSKDTEYKPFVRYIINHLGASTNGIFKNKFRIDSIWLD